MEFQLFILSKTWTFNEGENWRALGNQFPPWNLWDILSTKWWLNYGIFSTFFFMSSKWQPFLNYLSFILWAEVLSLVVLWPYFAQLFSKEPFSTKILPLKRPKILPFAPLLRSANWWLRLWERYLLDSFLFVGFWLKRCDICFKLIVLSCLLQCLCWFYWVVLFW